MSKMLVLGSDGRQGKALSWALEKLGHEVMRFDKPLVDPIYMIHNGLYDVIVSCLPYSQNTYLARQCIFADQRWADLGGNIQSTAKISKEATKADKPVATDLGLAPGLVEYHALSIINSSPIHKTPKEVYLYCGGLPQKPANALGYTITFSIAGLVNEYVNTPLSIADGVIKEAEPMGDVSRVSRFRTDLYGANTSGGVTKSFLQEMVWRGARHCKYQTLRYEDHWELVKTAWANVQEDRDCFAYWIQHGSTRGDPDIVYILVYVDGYYYSWIIVPGDDFSAMQRGTAFSAAAVVSVMASGEFDHLQWVTPEHIAKSESFWRQLDVLLPR